MNSRADKLSFGELCTNVPAKELNSLVASFYISREHNNNESGQQLNNLVSYFQRTIKTYFDKKGIQLEKASLFEGWTCDRFDSFSFFYTNIHRTIQSNEDTAVIQIGLSSSENAREAWPAMRAFLKEILGHWSVKLESAGADKSHVVFPGYTICYKSNIAAEKKSYDQLEYDVMKLAQPLFHDSAPYNLAHHSYENASLFLVNIPQETSLKSCIAYIALGVQDTNDEFIYQHVFSDNGNLLTTDAFVHKASYQSLQLSNDTFMSYNQLLTRLAAETEKVLSVMERTDKDRNTGEDITITSAILRKLLTPYTRYKRLRLSIHIQKKKFELNYQGGAHGSLRNNGIYEYYLRRISDQYQGAELSLERSEIILEQAKSVISLIETQQSKISNDHSAAIQSILTLLGIGIAFISIFDTDATVGLLKAIHLECPATDSKNVFWLNILVTKIIVVLAVMGLTWVITYFVRKALKKKSFRNHAKS